MTNTNTAAIESLRAFALTHNEVAFAHMCTAALAGEEWALGSIDAARRAFCGDLTYGEPDHGITLAHIRIADTARPDGAIAKSFQP